MNTYMAVYIIIGVVWGFTGVTAEIRILRRTPSARRFLYSILMWPLAVYILVVEARATRDMYIITIAAAKAAKKKMQDEANRG